MSKKHLLTQSDFDALTKEFRNLIDVKRPEIIAQLQEARAHGDLSENADYDAAKTEQGNIEKRINELQNILSNYQIIRKDKSSIDEVIISSIVTFKNLSTNEESTIEITGSEGANPWEGKISNESPLALALIGRKVGDEVEILGLDSTYSVKILKIE